MVIKPLVTFTFSYLHLIHSYMLQKKYGVEGLVDWKAQISAGRAKVIVHFTGGALTRFGVTPAEFTTKDAFIQRVIENSSYFKSGRIRILSITEVPDDAATILHKKRAAEKQALIEKAEAAKLEEANKAEVKTQKEEATPEAGTTTNVGPSTETAAANDTIPKNATSATKVEVTCLADAVEYLKQNFGYASSKLRSKPAAIQAAAEHNVEFVGL